jgi:hypothetical protein
LCSPTRRSVDFGDAIEVSDFLLIGSVHIAEFKALLRTRCDLVDGSYPSSLSSSEPEFKTLISEKLCALCVTALAWQQDHTKKDFWSCPGYPHTCLC